MEEKLKIWLRQRAESLPIDPNVRKMRTALLADELTARGHSVIWWTSAFDHFTKKWRVDKDSEIQIKDLLRVKALKGLGYKKNVSISRFIDHRIIARKFKKYACDMDKPDSHYPTHTQSLPIAMRLDDGIDG